jgi:iron complex outermembrane receptor protein
VDASGARDFYGINPKLGTTYALTPSIQLYGNVSRSFEPPMLGGDLIPSGGLPPGQAFLPLSAQRALTAGAATPGSWEWLRWDAAFYHSWVEDELLLFTPNPREPTLTQTLNASPTHPMGWS